MLYNVTNSPIHFLERLFGFINNDLTIKSKLFKISSSPR